MHHSYFLEIQETASRGRGLFAKQHIPKDTTILTLKEEHFISYSTFCDHPVFQTIMNKTSKKA